MSDFWEVIGSEEFNNEASVETKLVLPLLCALGYETGDIESKYPVVFQQGRVGRRPEADFVVFNGSTHDRNSSLIVVEAKSPAERLDDKAQAQAESYAFNVRSPFYILCNGIDLQVWQLQVTLECICIVDVKVGQLAAHRGKIEALISKEAAVAYCASLAWKAVTQDITSFDAYLYSEIRRVPRDVGFIARTLASSNEESPEIVSSDELINRYASVIITGPSGFGKTVISKALFEQSLKAALADPNSALPIEVPIPDIMESGQSFAEYILARLSAHRPGFTMAALRDLLREKGIFLVCDAFERVDRDAQRLAEISIKSLMRDYPLVRVFIFSRANSKPNILLPVLRINELSPEQRYEFRSRASSIFDSHEVLRPLPDVLERLCWHPLILQLIVDYIVLNRKQPDSLPSLFESWLLSTIELDPSRGHEAAIREKALTILAAETVSGPLTTVRSVELLTSNGIAGTVYDFLVRCDALRVTGRVVELQHEALADYLRALRIIQLDEEPLNSEISSVELKEDSLFFVLLMSLLESREKQRQLWKRISKMGVNAYLSALRFQADLSKESDSTKPELRSKNYLEDILDGITEPLSAYFPKMTEALTRILSNGRSGDLAISGNVSQKPFQVFHTIGTVGGDFPEKVNVRSQSGSGRTTYLNVEMAGLRMDTGREIGVGLLYSAVIHAIKGRRFLGGPILSNERALGRLRFLEVEYDFDFKGLSLRDIETALTPHSGEYCGSHAFHAPESEFGIDELLDDIKFLIGQGKETLDEWWVDLGGLKHPDDMSDAEISALLNEHYRRSQALYREIVEESFSNILRNLIAYPILPLRWDLVVSRKRAFGVPVVYYRWKPVANWADTGADVTFSNAQPNWDFKSDWESNMAALISLGRPSDRGIGTNGFSPLPDFEGQRWNGGYDGETSVMREAADLLINDINRMFCEIRKSLIF